MDLQGDKRKNSKGTLPSAAALHLGTGGRWALELKRAHCSPRRVLMCSVILFSSLPNGSLSQTWDWTKNQS